MVDFHFLKILLSVVFYFSLLFENSPVNFAVASLRAAKSSSSAVRFFCHSFHQSDHNSPTCNLLCIHTTWSSSKPFYSGTTWLLQTIYFPPFSLLSSGTSNTHMPIHHLHKLKAVFSIFHPFITSLFSILFYDSSLG